MRGWLTGKCIAKSLKPENGSPAGLATTGRSKRWLPAIYLSAQYIFARHSDTGPIVDAAKRVGLAGERWLVLDRLKPYKWLEICN
jgi:hypothetical protein